ncbi:hypothetical protein ACTFIV_001154 [Dictyostelium citrinum]
MNKIISFLSFLYFISFSFGYSNNVCTLNTYKGLIDLSPLTLADGGYFSGSFFDYTPKSFSLLFNICGFTTRCNSLGSNNYQTNAQSCAFYPQDGTAPPMGYINQSEIFEISNGVSLRYYGGKNGTTQLDIYCDPSAKTLNIYDCIRINAQVPLYKCSMKSMYACPIPPTPTPSTTPTSTPSTTPTSTPSTTPSTTPFTTPSTTPSTTPTPTPPIFTTYPTIKTNSTIYILINNLEIFKIFSFGYSNNVCTLNTYKGLIDLSPLTLPNGGYFSGSLLFNICGFTTRCNSLGSNNYQTNAQSCAFYPQDGTAPPMGYINQSEISEISNGVSLRYYGGKNGTTQLDIYCDPSAKTLNIYDCIRINTQVPLYKCSMNSMYACPIPPTPTPSSTPTSTPSTTPTSTPSTTPCPTPTPTPSTIPTYGKQKCIFNDQGLTFTTSSTITCNYIKISQKLLCNSKDLECEYDF